MADGFATLLMLLLPAALVYVYFATHIASRSSCIDLASAVAYRAAYSYTYTRVAQLKYSRLLRLIANALQPVCYFRNVTYRPLFSFSLAKRTCLNEEESVPVVSQFLETSY